MSPPEFDSAIDTRPDTAFDGPEKWSELGPNSESRAWDIREQPNRKELLLILSLAFDFLLEMFKMYIHEVARDLIHNDFSLSRKQRLEMFFYIIIAFKETRLIG